MLLCLNLSITKEVIALDKPVQNTLSDKEYVEVLVAQYSTAYKIDSVSLMNTIQNENDTFDFDRQSELKYKEGNRWGFPAGTQEKSYGICQIHLPDHPEISYEQAIDPDFCIEYMAQQFAQGNASQWMGYEA